MQAWRTAAEGRRAADPVHDAMRFMAHRPAGLASEDAVHALVADFRDSLETLWVVLTER